MRPLLAGRIELAVPAANAWAFIRDMENYPRWFPRILRMRAIDAQPIAAVGKRYSELAVVPGGKEEAITVEVVAADENAMHLAIEASLEPILPRFDYRVIPAGADACVFDWQAHSRGSGAYAWVGCRVFRRIVGPRLKTALFNLKRILEHPPEGIMRAAQFREFGTPDDTVTIEPAAQRPRPKKGEVLVRQFASSINHIDCMRRQGYGRRMMRMRGALERPVTLGNDICGIVAAVGPEVSGLAPGDRVLGVKPPSSAGTFADYVVAKPELLVPLSEAVDPLAVAGAPYVFLTAWNALVDEGQLLRMSDARVFVQGGGGGVGAMAVQIAKFLGAEVIASCAASQMETVSRMGADRALDYATTDFSALAGSFDLVICTASAAEQDSLLTLLKEGAGARYVTVIHPTLSLIDNHGVLLGLIAAKRELRALNARLAKHRQSAHWVLFKPRPEALAQLSRMIADGSLVVPVDSVWTLEEAAQAQQRLESGEASGKVILKIGTEREFAR